MLRRCNPRGLTRVEVLVVALVGVFVLTLLPTVWHRGNPHRARLACAANLATLGKAMLLYANDYAGAFPRAGGRNTTWGEMVRWNASSREAAFGLAADGSGGEATISSCFYLLVRHGGVLPKHMVCPRDKGTTEFRLSDVSNVKEGLRLTDAWDFGPEAWKHCSYAYHMPFGLYALTTAHDPGMPLAADRNPWLKSPAGEAKQLPTFRPDLPLFKGTREQARKGNSMSHGEDGQNVLFVDGHVAFEERSYCGLEHDNIYLLSGDVTQGSPIGWVPVPPLVAPMNRKDSVRVHDPPRNMVRPPEGPDVDSKDLKQTVVLATLDCPLPEHKNAIWCATFQMAWDRFMQDIVGEPIQISAARGLVDRLNRSQFPSESIEEKSYYAAAGAVRSGIIQQIQREMKRRFPSQPIPTFGSQYRTLPDVMVAYAYLNIGIEFERPYYACPAAFDFVDSTGTHAGVTAFRVQTPVPDGCYDVVRGQVEVLYHDFGSPAGGEQFAVDLSKRTQPYQVVLARLPHGNTLEGTAKLLREKIVEFQNRPNQKVEGTLRQADTLIVPDVLYKLTHQFDELLNRNFDNRKWTEYFFFEALQKIDFTLSRTGVVLKSEARLAATRGGGGPTKEPKPRHFHFDRPFLICVQKREPNATPFFLMWVDNAELMRPYANGDHKE